MLFDIGRDVDVDDAFQLRDVESTRGHVGRNQHRAAAVGELDQHLIAVTLLEIAVQSHGHQALGAEHVDQIAALAFGVAEGDGAGRTEMRQQQRDGMQPLVLADFVGCLLYTSPSPRDRQKSRMPSSA